MLPEIGGEIAWGYGADNIDFYTKKLKIILPLCGHRVAGSGKKRK